MDESVDVLAALGAVLGSEVLLAVVVAVLSSSLLAAFVTAYFGRRTAREVNRNTGQTIEVQRGGMVVEAQRVDVLKQEAMTHAYEAASVALKTALETSGSVLIDTIGELRTQVHDMQAQVSEFPAIKAELVQCRQTEGELRSRLRAVEIRQGVEPGD